jgi:hypothetical protein
MVITPTVLRIASVKTRHRKYDWGKMADAITIVFIIVAGTSAILLDLYQVFTQ